MAKEVKGNREKEVKKPVTNFMGGTSYELNPIDTMKMVTASSIFGEPQYYRKGKYASANVRDGVYQVNPLVEKYIVELPFAFEDKKTSDIMEEVIDAALKYDFAETLEYAIKLRKEFLMRLNPQIIMVRAALMKEERKKFTEENPGKFNEINEEVMLRADDVLIQITYFLSVNGSKKNCPNILKRSWAQKIESLNLYQMAKYKEKEIGMIDAIRICHAKGKLVDELMKTGTLAVTDNERTWENLKSENKTWSEILERINMPHMALLRNLRNIFSEITDEDKVTALLTQLENGVRKGKQFPYRYLSAYNAVKSSDMDEIIKSEVMDKLEDCMDISCENLPKLKGKSAFLSDNSGSAWGACPSEYGTMTVAKIDNLSSVIGAVNSEHGVVVKFGDKVKEFPISKRNGILKQAEEISRNGYSDVGGATECGIWLFLDDAIENNKVYDNIFIYSDMQAGHGELYGTGSEKRKYVKKNYATRNGYIDVMKLLETYRCKVNPKVNVYCVQTAGYDNVVVPENCYRTNILYGWTGKELVYAKAMNDFWDSIDAKKSVSNN